MFGAMKKMGGHTPRHMRERDALPVRVCRWVESHGTLMALLALAGYVSSALDLVELVCKVVDLLLELLELVVVLLG